MVAIVLPSEIVLHIADEIVAATPAHLPSYSRLVFFALTCKPWYLLLIPALYRKRNLMDLLRLLPRVPPPPKPTATVVCRFPNDANALVSSVQQSQAQRT